MPKRRDARKLDAAALQRLRRQVVQAVRGGMWQTEAARTFGASLRAVSKWMRLDREGGLRVLTLRRRGTPPGGDASTRNRRSAFGTCSSIGSPIG